MNIVRLRYTNTPSSLAISNIADQQELASELQAIRFFVPGAINGFHAAALPQATLKLLLEVSRLELQSSEANAPLLTLPLGKFGQVRRR